jgi:hypothetical protein
MHDLLIHELGARRVHWRYDDPNGLPDTLPAGGRGAGRPIRSAGEVRARVWQLTTPKAV